MSSLRPNHVLPSSSSFSIGMMMTFMMTLTGFCILALFGIYTLTHQWMAETEHALVIEIAAYDETSNTVFDNAQLQSDLMKIERYLNNDPLIQAIEVTQFQEDLNDIPNPVFITLTLIDNRIKNAEDRLIENISVLVPNTYFKGSEIWQNEIRNTAITLQSTFGGLTIIILMVTGVLLSSQVKNQLQTNDQTIHLIHLMGGQTSQIAQLFQRYTLIPILYGSCLSLIILLITLSPLLVFIDIQINILMFYGVIAFTIFAFIALCQIVTYFTVMRTLRYLP